MVKKIAVVLSGCGFKDGSEITEAVSTLIALSQNGAEFSVFAPDQTAKAINHVSGQPEQERNMLTEAARIARGEAQPLSALKVSDFDGLVLPGGYGAAVNLSDFGSRGAAGSVLPEVDRVIREFHSSEKPIGAICIAPAVVAKVLGSKNVTVTIGNDPETAAEIEKTGAHHQVCAVDDFITDRENKVVTTPAYMYETKPHLVFKGISGLIKEIVEMA